jgi:hypothetical protein
MKQNIGATSRCRLAELQPACEPGVTVMGPVAVRVAPPTRRCNMCAGHTHVLVQGNRQHGQRSLLRSPPTCHANSYVGSISSVVESISLATGKLCLPDLTTHASIYSAARSSSRHCSIAGVAELSGARRSMPVSEWRHSDLSGRMPYLQVGEVWAIVVAVCTAGGAVAINRAAEPPSAVA